MKYLQYINGKILNNILKMNRLILFYIYLVPLPSMPPRK